MTTTTARSWWRPLKVLDDVTVAYVNLAPNEVHESGAFEWLDEEERLRWQRFQNPAPQRRFSLCRAALRHMLCEYANCSNERLSFTTAKHGKPYAKVGGRRITTSFNISHSGRHGLIAIASSGRLGVDVEERVPRRNLEYLIEGVFSNQEKAELKLLDGCQKLHKFFRFWTIKEALVKAHGKGLSMNVAELEIPAEIRHGATSSICQFAQIPNASWCLEDIGTKEFAAAVAYEVESAT